MDDQVSCPLVIHVLVRETKEGVEAHCLEIDHVAVGKTQAAALNTLYSMVRSQFSLAREFDDRDSLFFPAPVEYWRLLARGTSIGSRLITLDAETLEYIPAAVDGIKANEYTCGRERPVRFQPSPRLSSDPDKDIGELPVTSGRRERVMWSCSYPAGKGPKYTLGLLRPRDFVGTAVIKAMLRRFGIDERKFWSRPTSPKE